MKETLLGRLGFALLYPTYRSGSKLAKVERSLTINYQLSIINCSRLTEIDFNYFWVILNFVDRAFA
jgi:hypothetical protein